MKNNLCSKILLIKNKLDIFLELTKECMLTFYENNILKYDFNNYNQKITDVEESITKLLLLTSAEKKTMNKEIISKICYFNNLTDKIEDRRSKIQTFSYQYVAILLTILGVLISNKISFSTSVNLLIYLCLGTQIFITILIIITYYFQSNFHYPFNDIEDYSNQWKWFYKGNKHIQKMKRSPLYTQNHKESKSNIHYLEGLKFIIDKYTAENLDTDLKNNIIQLYLLQAHNYYKNKFFLQLTNIRKWGLYLILDILVGFTIYNFFFDKI